MRLRLLLGIALLLGLVSGCNLAPVGSVQQTLATTPTGAATGRPTVTIISPQDGAEFVTNSQILVSVNATDSVGVTRVQLIANNQIVKTVSSEAPTGEQNFSALLDYVPRTPGTLNMQVIAFRAAVASDPARLTVNVRESEAQVTSTPLPNINVPNINPNDPTCRALVNTGLNLRSGPGTNFERISVLSAGTVVPIIGRTGANDWWQVRVNTVVGWISASFTTVFGICTGVPVVATPPPPTSVQPTATNTPPPPTNTLTLTPVPPTPTPTPGPADLVVTGITGPTTVALGPGNTPTTVTYSVTITNSGASPTGPFNNIIRVMPGGSEVPLGVVSNLNPGESILLNTSLTFSVAGTYTVEARADSDNQVPELSDVNNSGFISVTVTEAGPGGAMPPLITLDPILVLTPFVPVLPPGFPGP